MYKSAPFAWGFFLPETKQCDQQPEPSLPVEIVSLCQQGAQFGAAPSNDGAG
ncbi:hypothetical protein [Shewanella sp. OMA3-2]|uniref:hypothetical protein n=1 Tax=Shewanella sp. OMA3-2 TaxID=2908650 RepID=UPI001F438670|nr:hypothetical protein [Shewanella sp. OMA3-2]UJF21697.1 hypothetical protein L0B17_16840 [Shewanella sp. OMA3-2]